MMRTHGDHGDLNQVMSELEDTRNCRLLRTSHSYHSLSQLIDGASKSSTKPLKVMTSSISSHLPNLVVFSIDIAFNAKI